MAPAPPLQVPDWHRFWFGSEVPVAFLGEVVLRIVVLYAVLAVAIRFMGRRTSSELTRNELMGIVALAAAIGPSIQAPDRGLLPPILIAVWVVLWQRLVASLTVRSPGFERAMQGQGLVVVTDGVVQIPALKRSAVSRERLFAELRSHGLLHLGHVKRLYLEADGSFSLVKQCPPRPGLALIPAFDPQLRAELPDDWTYVACAHCGRLRERHAVEARCRVCSGDAWLPPVGTPS
jgi:hypothetical protein